MRIGIVEKNMDSSFTSYMKKNFSLEDGSFFRKWDFEKILRDREEWSISNSSLTVYMIINDHKRRSKSFVREKPSRENEQSISTTTTNVKSVKKNATYASTISHQKNNCHLIKSYIGASCNEERRLKQHRGELPGGPQETKKTVRDWKFIVKINIPPCRNFSAKIFKKHHKNAKKTWKQKCVSIVKKALQIGLKTKLMKELLKENSELFIESLKPLYQQNKQLIELF